MSGGASDELYVERFGVAVEFIYQVLGALVRRQSFEKLSENKVALAEPEGASPYLGRFEGACDVGGIVLSEGPVDFRNRQCAQIEVRLMVE